MKEVLTKHVINKEIIYEKVLERRNGYMRKAVTVLAVAVVIAGGALFYNYNLKNDVKYNLVTVDINPSVGFMIDEDQNVVEVLTLNDDAVVAVEDLKLEGMNIEEAIDKVVDTSIEMGYIDELSEDNVVNVTTYLEDEKENDELNAKIRTKVETRLEARKVNSLVIKNGLDEEMKAKADEYDISYGKMLIISRATNLDKDLVEKDLVDMSIKEIQASIKAKSTEVRNQIKEYYNDNKDEMKAKKEIIIEEAKEKVRTTKENIINKVDNYKNLTEPEKEAIIEQRKEQIKETVTEVKEAIQSGTKEAINAIREQIQEKRGN